MIRAINILLSALVAAAISQYVQQSGPLSVNNITSGVPVLGTLRPSAEESTALHVILYQFWVPENTSSVNITFTLTNTLCDHLNFQLSTIGLPCNNDAYDTSYPSSPCAPAWAIESGATDVQENFTH
eukprot:TRINITY_DN13_c1_g2_i1.p1 TRINITY_DN13_c1_g2~~TRINITY_DN13_c1_g2_i1.p1  ORF type:complete len:127 (+),score=18.23 TRINITY_DN13_c1_g2_i1:115-495(+)